MFEEYSREQIEKNLKTVLTLEWLGIHIEDTKEKNDEYGIPSKTVYYFSVPETSTIEIAHLVFPVPVAITKRRRFCPFAILSIQRLIALR